MLGAIEAGGSKFVCGIGTTPADLITAQIPTTTPAETLEAVVEFFRREAGDELVAAVDPVRENAHRAADEYGGQDFSGVEEMLEALTPEAAVVATPPNVHLATATPLLRAGDGPGLAPDGITGVVTGVPALTLGPSVAASAWTSSSLRAETITL